MSVATMPLPVALPRSPRLVPADAEPITPDDLLKMGQKGLLELVDGELIEKPMGALSGKTAIVISNRLYPFVRAEKLGELYSETSFLCFPAHPGRTRRPDIAFVAAARAAGVPDEGHVPIRPDLCIEVVSPGDGAYDLDGKLEDYESVGVPLTWVFNPALRIVRVYRPGQPTYKFRAADTLDGDDVLPGFAAVVGELFPDVLASA